MYSVSDSKYRGSNQLDSTHFIGCLGGGCSSRYASPNPGMLYTVLVLVAAGVYTCGAKGGAPDFSKGFYNRGHKKVPSVHIPLC